MLACHDIKPSMTCRTWSVQLAALVKKGLCNATDKLGRLMCMLSVIDLNLINVHVCGILGEGMGARARSLPIHTHMRSCHHGYIPHAALMLLCGEHVRQLVSSSIKG